MLFGKGGFYFGGCKEKAICYGRMSNENRRLSLSVLGSFVRLFTFLIPEKKAKRGKYLGFSSFPAYECSFLQRIFIHSCLSFYPFLPTFTPKTRENHSQNPCLLRKFPAENRKNFMKKECVCYE